MNKSKDLILRQFYSFTNESHSLILARQVVFQKIRNQYIFLSMLARKQPDLIERSNVSQVQSFMNNLNEERIDKKHQIFLVEAKASSIYWNQFSKIIRERGQEKIIRSKKTRQGANRLLDIGYHYLGVKIRQQIETFGLWPEIGFLHTYRRGNTPFVYDVMELFRQPIVDKTLLHFINQSKRNHQQEMQIPSFLKRLKMKWIKEGMDQIIENEINKFYRFIKFNEPFSVHIWKWGHKKKKA